MTRMTNPSHIHIDPYSHHDSSWTFHLHSSPCGILLYSFNLLSLTQRVHTSTRPHAHTPTRPHTLTPSHPHSITPIHPHTHTPAHPRTHPHAPSHPTNSACTIDSNCPCPKIASVIWLPRAWLQPDAGTIRAQR